MRVILRIFFSVVLMLCFTCGCNRQPPRSASEPTAERMGATASPDSTFDLAAHPENSYSAGKKAAFTISLKPRGEYHINQQFPTSVAIQGPRSIALETPKLLKADATLFTEKTVKFNVAFSPSEAGEYEVNALVSFAVCTDKTCIPLQKNLTVLLKVD